MEIIRAIPTFERIGLRKSAGYKRVKEGLLPPPIKIGKRASGWPKHEIDTIVTLMVSGASEEEIRSCVTKMVTLRKAITLESSRIGGFDE